MLSSRTLIPIRYAETDRMGVVHHSHYPVFFEAGRTDFFAEHLIHYDDMERQGVFAPILELKLEIAGRASYGDTLSVLTFPTWLKGLRLAMHYRVERQDGVAVASGSSLHALCDAQLKPLHPRKFPQLYARLRDVFSDAG